MFIAAHRETVHARKEGRKEGREKGELRAVGRSASVWDGELAGPTYCDSAVGERERESDGRRDNPVHPSVR